MSTIKERIIGAVSIMNDSDAEKLWQLIQATFSLANAPESIAEENELAILKEYSNGNPDYQPLITHTDILKNLNL